MLYDKWLINFIVEHKGDQLGASVPDAEEHDCDEYFDLLFEEFIKADLFIEADFDEYRELDISDFRRIYENEYDRSERFPIKSDMFNEDYIYGFDLLEMLNYEPSMNWVPSEIREKCGEIHNTVLDGEVLHFDIANTDKIALAFEAMGYKCVRDELLVAKAYGQA